MQALIASRYLQYVGGCVLFGAAAFSIINLPQVSAIPRRWMHGIFISAATCLAVGAVMWLVAQTLMVNDMPLVKMAASDCAYVAFSTSFGRICTARLLIALLCLGLAFDASKPGVSWILALLGAVLLGSFAWTGHGATTGTLHLGSDIVHLLAAGLWLGALGPLLLLIVNAGRMFDRVAAQLACQALERFAMVGTVAVVLLTATGIVNSWMLIGPDQIWNSLQIAYGQVLLAKIALFCAMLGLATANRFRFTPALANALDQQVGAVERLFRLRRSIAIEVGVGCLVLLAVAWLGILEPVGTDGS